MPNILCFGAGGVGITYLYLLQKGGATTTAVCRSNYTTAKSHGFTLSSQIWGEHTFHPNIVSSAEDAIATGPYDFIIVCSKAYVGLSPSTAELIRPAVSPDTAIVLCQNGIGIEEEYAAAFPENTIISGVVYLPVTQVKQGHVVHGDLEMLEIGLYPSPASPATDTSTTTTSTPSKAQSQAEIFVHTFQAGGGTIQLYPDIQSRRWTKLITNASWNPICALSQCSDRDFLLSSPLALDLVRRAMLEVVAVARAKGYTSISNETAEWQLSRAIGRLEKPEGKEPSMLTDVREGRHRWMEVEPIVGNVVRAGKEVGVEVGTLETIYVLIKGLSLSKQPVLGE